MFLKQLLNEINEAVNLASQAYLKHLKHTSGKQKAEFLNAIADEILALDDELDSNLLFRNWIARRKRAKGERGRTSWSVTYVCRFSR